jgi:UDP-3-O-[3-hydroxymyristoyl] glucosamine N-acyltransferase
MSAPLLRLRLSQFRDVGPISIVRDGEFEALGYLNARQEGLLVPLRESGRLDELIANPRVVAVITTPELAGAVPARYATAVSAGPLEAFYRVHLHLNARGDFYWTSFATQIASDAQVHPRSFVSPTDVRIGHRTVIGPNATVLPHTLIGDDAVIWSGVVLGADGLEGRVLDGELTIIPHAGGVRLGDRVHVQANSVVNRSLFGGFTELGDDTKLGSLVNIAHNAAIGKRCRIIDTAMLAGSCTIGDDVWIGPGVVVGTGVVVGSGCTIGAQSFVKHDLPPGVKAWGTPAEARPPAAPTHDSSR